MLRRIFLKIAWRSGSERRFYDDHDRKVNGSTPNLVSLLGPGLGKIDIRLRYSLFFIYRMHWSLYFF